MRTTDRWSWLGIAKSPVTRTESQRVGRDVSLDQFIAAVGQEVVHHALRATPIDPLLAISANRERMLGALANLLQNAFKFTLPDTEIALNAYAFGHHILIDVKDHCGGWPHGDVERMFSPLTQRSTDRSGLGLGLSTSRQSIEADGGTLGAKDLPGTGCIFTISLPRATVGKPGL